MGYLSFEPHGCPRCDETRRDHDAMARELESTRERFNRLLCNAQKIAALLELKDEVLLASVTAIPARPNSEKKKARMKKTAEG